MAIFSSLRFSVKAVRLPGGRTGLRGRNQMAQYRFREPAGPGCYILKRHVRRI